MKHISQIKAQEIDQQLMGKYGFSLDILMELAGFSVAEAVLKTYPPVTHRRILICAGPGNNGGDALVAARHLFHFGYAPTILYPKQPQKQIFINLTHQCKSLGIPFVDALTHDIDVILDGIFGFSFDASGIIRPPFDSLLKDLKSATSPIVSIDIPSGWNVDKPEIDTHHFMPQVIISLTAPKLCTMNFKGIHYLGGRFVPPMLAEEYGLYFGEIQFKGAEQSVCITSL